MPFDSQFSLSLELTRLLPLGPSMNAIGGAIGRVARELQLSGSDFVVEEDLAAVFGRLRICEHFERTFRSVVGRTQRTAISKILDIVLESGAGPTVQRALTTPSGEFRYLSTVIQLSLLSFVHERAHLADGLSHVLQQRLNGAPSNHPQAPGYDALFGTIRACHEQTVNFQWTFIFDRVHVDLGQAYEQAFGIAYPDESKHPLALRSNCRALSHAVLQGLLDMLLAIQSLPEDRTIYIQTLKGVPTIVTWAHHVLGSTVVVNLFDGDDSQPKIFGNGPPQIVIDARCNPADRDGEICLLSRENEKLFFLSTAEDSSKAPLEASKRCPLLGFGRNAVMSLVEQQRVNIEPEIEDNLLRQIALDLVSHGIASFLQPGSVHYQRREPDYGQTLEDFCSLLKSSPYEEWHRVERVLSLIFQVQVVGIQDEVFALLRDSSRQYHHIPKVKSYTIPESKSIKIIVEPLVVLIMGFSCVDDIEDCADLLLPDCWCYQAVIGFPSSNLRNRKTRQIWGEFSYSDDSSPSKRCWDESTLLNLFARILIGPDFRMGNERMRFDKTSLISELGWSVFIPTVDFIDPSKTNLYRIYLKRGVPIRNEIRKRRIEDGGIFVKSPKNPTDSSIWHGSISNGDPQLEAADDSSESVITQIFEKDCSKVSFSGTKVGITDNAFVVTHTIGGSSWGTADIGIRAMHRVSLYEGLRRLNACEHYTTWSNNGSLAPEVSNVYIANGPDALLANSIPNKKKFKTLQRNGYFLLPTFGNIEGRWLCLFLARSALGYPSGTKKIGLRHPQTCPSCVMNSIESFEFKDLSGRQYQGHDDFEQRVIIL